jgi:hypothetical protein
MTSIENTLALQLAKESFGALTGQVVALLLKRKACPLLLIAQDLKLDRRKVAEVLAILSAHFLVEYRLNARHMVEYSFRTDRCLDRLKIAR